jgi:poly(hydroxyalkanoate) depolymerase family esterase
MTSPSPFEQRSSSRYPSPHGRTGTFTAHRYGIYTYKVYVPTRYRPGRALPLVVMLHGCTQNADDFAMGTRMNEFAEKHMLLVLYPEQAPSANNKRCWNWFRSQNQMRDQGEPAAIVGMVDQVRKHYTIDRSRIYAAGISAGAAMTVTLGATYPDIFAAIGVCAGVPYGSADSASTAMSTMWRGSFNSRLRGNAAYAAMGEYRRVVPVILFHGTADSLVAPINARQLVRQWSQTNRLATDGTTAPSEPVLADVTTAAIPEGHTYTRRVYEGSDGSVMIETYLVEHMGHSWPGGSPTGSFTDPQGPDASRLMVEFFLQHPMVEVPGPQPLDVVATPAKPAIPPARPTVAPSPAEPAAGPAPAEPTPSAEPAATPLHVEPAPPMEPVATPSPTEPAHSDHTGIGKKIKAAILRAIKRSSR